MENLQNPTVRRTTAVAPIPYYPCRRRRKIAWGIIGVGRIFGKRPLGRRRSSVGVCRWLACPWRGGNAGIGCRGVDERKRSVVAVCPEGGSARKSQPAMQSFLSTDMAFDIA